MNRSSEWEIGKRSGTGAIIYGQNFSRTGTAADVPEGVDAVFLQIGRIPFAFSVGGYVAPEED